MKIFLSWSGGLSRNLAEILREWLPAVIQAVKPYFSLEDNIKGARWATEIAKELDESEIGIICLTPDNLSAPWLLFEAGALSKNIDRAKVCPILFNLKPTDIQGPLVQFQLAEFEKAEIWRVVKMINEVLGDSALDGDVLGQVFEMWWPRLKERVDSELSSHERSGNVEIRTDRDLLEEVLELTRANVPRADLRGAGATDPDAITDEKFAEYCRKIPGWRVPGINSTEAADVLQSRAKTLGETLIADSKAGKIKDSAAARLILNSLVSIFSMPESDDGKIRDAELSLLTEQYRSLSSRSAATENNPR